MSRRESGTSTWPFLLGLIALLALMAALTLLPIGWKMNRFVVWLYYDGLHLYASPLTAWLYFDQLSFLLNVLLTVPIGLLARFAFPRLAWRVVGLAVLVLSGCVEVAQLVLPLGREATWGDVASNTIGGFAGALIGRWWIRRRAADAPFAEPLAGDSVREARGPGDED